MKKIYMKPLTKVEQIKIETYLQVPSVTGVAGNAGIQQASPEEGIPGEAGAKDRGYGSDSDFGNLW